MLSAKPENRKRESKILFKDIGVSRYSNNELTHSLRLFFGVMCVPKKANSAYGTRPLRIIATRYVLEQVLSFLG